MYIELESILESLRGDNMFGERLRSARKSSNLNQEQLGRLCGTTKQSISAWESGYEMPSVDKLRKLAECLHVSADYLLELDDCIFCFKGMHSDDFQTLIMVAQRLTKVREKSEKEDAYVQLINS